MSRKATIILDTKRSIKASDGLIFSIYFMNFYLLIDIFYELSHQWSFDEIYLGNDRYWMCDICFIKCDIKQAIQLMKKYLKTFVEQVESI